MDVEESIAKIVRDGNNMEMHKLAEILDEVIESLEVYDKECSKKYEMEIYKMAYGPVLTREMAEDLVSKMKPFGKKWSFEETKNIQDQYGLDGIRPSDFFVVINSAYNDYKDLFGDDMEKYIRFTLDFINDEDAKDGKVFTYFTTIPK